MPRGRETVNGLIDVRIGAQVLENLLPLLLVHHQIDALPAVASLHPPLGLAERPRVSLPIDVAALQAALPQRLLPVRSQPFEQLIIESHVELAAPRVALPPGA